MADNAKKKIQKYLNPLPHSCNTPIMDNRNTAMNIPANKK